MNASRLGKFASACTPVAAEITRTNALAAMSRNVAKCQEMSRSDGSSDKTKPPPSAAPHGQPRPLAPRQLTAIELLLAGSTVAAAAVRLNVNPRTIFRWLNDPHFREEIDRRADLAERFQRAQRAVHVAKRREMS